MLKNIELEIETIIQFAIALMQITGTFLIKPSVFELYNHGTMFLAGDPAIFLMFLLAVSFVILSMDYNKPMHIKYWIIATLCVSTIFLFFLFKYNSDIRAKTFLGGNCRWACCRTRYKRR